MDIWEDNFKQREQKMVKMGNKLGMFEKQKKGNLPGDEQTRGREL